MKKTFFALFVSGVMLLASCNKQVNKVEPVYNQGINIIPMPMSLTQGQGKFEVTKNTVLSASDDSSKVIAEYFASIIRRSTGYGIPVESGEKDIHLMIDPSLDLNDEGYTLKSDDNGVKIVGKTAQGLFYGMQSLMQLLPAEIQSTDVVDSVYWNIPAVEIKDQPVFSYRGMHLDVCRHFLPVEEVKKHIDVISLFKINRLHFHLTEDQGWRIEIKKYPKLTEIGSKRIEGDGTEYSGYYTQEEIKDLVKYAEERFVTIVPEIELPGHAMAAIASYPELATDPNKEYKVRHIWGVEDDVYDASNEKVFEFISDIFDEIAPLFPSKYIHIGGDECPKISWKNSAKCQAFMRANNIKTEEELQSYFIKRAEKIAEEHGKYIIGWDEILEGGLPETATVMSWRGEEGGITASNQGHDVIMTPGSGGLYLDHYQGDPMVEPLAIGGYAPLSKTYSYDPVPKDIKEENRHHILGAQGNVWSEYLYTPELFDYRAYPRILAIAELTWTPKDKKNFDDFSRRLGNAYVRLDAFKVNYHIPIPEQPNGSCDNIVFIDSTTLELKTSRPMPIVYSMNNEELNNGSKLYTAPISIKENTVVNTACVLPSGKLSTIRKITFSKVDYNKSVDVENPVAGLTVKRAKDIFKSADDVMNVTDWDQSDIITKVPEIVSGIGKRSRPDELLAGAVAEGYINVDETGVYEFYSNYEQLYIDNKLLIDNSGVINKFSRKNTTVALEKGMHKIKIVYFDIVRGGFPSFWDDGQIYFRLWGAEKQMPVNEKMIFHTK